MMKRGNAMSFAEEVRGIFGVESERRAGRALRRRVEVLPGFVTLIMGDSGAGKSRLMRAAVEKLRAAGWRVANAEDFSIDDSRAIVETFGELSLRKTLAVLSRAGLAEAGVLLRPARKLSAGEQFRYRLARAMAEAENAKHETRNPKRVVIVCDEFAALLDRVTARVVAFGLRKMIAGTNVAALVATSHDDLAADLGGRVVRV
jgi:ABC-type ATPase with predicted acetyltransferase domain